jgi:hypothetical protein
MRRVTWLMATAATMLFATPAIAAPLCKGADAPMKVNVDAKRHTITVTVGPCRIAPIDNAMSMPGMMGGEASGVVDIKTNFLWPVSGYMRGFMLTLFDSTDKVLPQNTMHHLELVNFDRRQLLHNLAERVLGIGEETAGANVPGSVGIPLDRGTHMGLYIMWNNETNTDIDGVTLQLRMHYSPANMTPRPLAVLPFKVDVNLHPGLGDAFNLPKGGGERSAEFTVPVSGRLIGVGGHLHDFGRELRLEDVSSGKVLARVRAQRRADGTVTGVGHQLFGLWGRGSRLVPGRQYRLVAVYDHPDGAEVIAAMGIMGGIFAPDHIKEWPAVDKNDPGYIRDLLGAPMPAPEPASRKVP